MIASDSLRTTDGEATNATDLSADYIMRKVLVNIDGKICYLSLFTIICAAL